MLNTIKRLDKDSYIRAIINPAFFRPYSPPGNVDMLGRRSKNIFDANIYNNNHEISIFAVIY